MCRQRMFRKVARKCLVCGDTTKGKYFGAIACLSCAAFFRKSARLPLFYYQCKRSHNCHIDVQSRKRCPACRWAKCLAKGMRRGIPEVQMREGFPPNRPGSPDPGSPPLSAGSDVSAYACETVEFNENWRAKKQSMGFGLTKIGMFRQNVGCLEELLEKRFEALESNDKMALFRAEQWTLAFLMSAFFSVQQGARGLETLSHLRSPMAAFEGAPFNAAGL